MAEATATHYCVDSSDAEGSSGDEVAGLNCSATSKFDIVQWAKGHFYFPNDGDDNSFMKSCTTSHKYTISVW